MSLTCDSPSRVSIVRDKMVLVLLVIKFNCHPIRLAMLTKLLRLPILVDKRPSYIACCTLMRYLARESLRVLFITHAHIIDL